MRVLALDTTTRVSAAALIDDDRVIAERTGDPSRSHAERLPGELLALLDDAGMPLAAIDVFAIAAGPGSFTGLRIGMATVQGLAFVTGRRVVSVSVLEALAHAGSASLPAGALIGAWMNAQRREVFAALYRVNSGEIYNPARLSEVAEPVVGAPAAIAEEWTARGRWPAALIGDGAEVYAADVGGRTMVMAAPPLAGAIGRIASHRARAGAAVDPAALQPLYVRRPDAELARDRRG
jgi:tRNA threonylcarbamoyladenosine biosynthesis protein TsaB